MQTSYAELLQFGYSIGAACHDATSKNKGNNSNDTLNEITSKALKKLGNKR